MRHIVMCSGGGGSYAAAKKLEASLGHPPELLFADTLIEDDDLYRFLVESAADTLGRRNAVAGLRGLLGDIPPVNRPGERKVHLSRLRAASCALLPGLHWVADGRTPWELFRDERFVGNTRVASCSHVLKQDVSRSWLERHCDPEDTTVYVGIHWSEMDRFTGTKKKKGSRELWKPWRCRAPLCETPFEPHAKMFELMRQAGIEVPRLYKDGFPHNNCGGFCVKGGHDQFKMLLEKYPERYAHHEGEEQSMREYLGKDVAILRDRRGGMLSPLPMADLRRRLQGGDEEDTCEASGGCGCFSSDREPDTGGEDGSEVSEL